MTITLTSNPARRPLRSLLLGGVMAVSTLPALAAAPAMTMEERCGWFSNPAADEAVFSDRDGDWRVASAGQPPAEGKWPVFSKKQWVSKDKSRYGYGCACMAFTATPETKIMHTITSAKATALAVCRKSLAADEPKK